MTRSERGPARPLVHVLVALLALRGNCEPSGPSPDAARFLQDLPQHEVVHPTRVDVRGRFLSNFLSHHARRIQRREASREAPTESDRVYYQLWHEGHSLHLNLTLNTRLLAPGFLTERRFGGLEGARIDPPVSSQCHFFGEVWEEAVVKGSAAISTCDGLTGLFKLSDEEFFIQPLERPKDEASSPRAHAVFKRHTSAATAAAATSSWSPLIQSISGKLAVNGSCGVKMSHQSLEALERRRERWEHRQQTKRRRIRQRSVSQEKWVETLVVADPKMVEYHGSEAVEDYVLSVMNIVAGLFQDASIGNAINIVVVRLILLEQDEDDLKITHHADNSLNSFCKWQKQLNMKGDDHPLHHDVAVLLTRKDICAAINAPCETLGLSHVAGMCQAHRSCSISEDTGLPLAFTVAHELGHNFGIQHDGNGNDCEPIGKRPFVMSPQLLYGTSLPRWSRCSRQYITRFLDRGWGWCLEDSPVKDKLSLNLVLPGVLYSAAHQCRLQYGSGSLLCDDMDNVCSTLWCTVGTTCHSKLDGAVDGTSCGENKWCFNGECVAVGYRPVSVDGGWAAWSEWSACTRSCGAGVQSAQRECDNPVPRYRGKYCLGERRRYRICNTLPCPNELPSFRDTQCSHFNSMPYKGIFYKWVSVINRASPCELHCRPLNEHFSEKMLDAVADGTPCLEGNKSRDMCINGICKKIGCDYVIDSSAMEDRCGVCHGNGSTCTTVRRMFEESEGLGYVDIGLIPEGAWDIRIEEVAAAGNFLALRSDNPNEYFLNGGWTIQWNGEYKAAGTVFTYERTGQLENLTSPGPTMEPLWIQLLFQETNPGVRYEYTISQNVSENNQIPASFFFWKYGLWTECSVTCGEGVQRQIVHCVERTTGIVEEHFCDPLTRPDDNQTRCNKEPCPAIWWIGEWQKCSASCGSSGLTKRTVLCIQAISVEEQKALQPSDCKHIPRPESQSFCNTHIPCPAEWTTNSWSKCSVTCGSGVRRRNVTCSQDTRVDCDIQKKPLSIATCNLPDCPQEQDNFGNMDWSGSGWSSKEVLNEINSLPEAKPPPKYGTTRAQPRTNNGFNNILEGDFHYHNNIENIENSLENSVQVDDFYYDYNFINFHEDLSDEDDVNDSGEWQESDVPQSADPTRGGAENLVTTGAPVISKATTITLNTVEPPAGSLDQTDIKTKESAILDDFLSEDYLLPVSTTRSPTQSTNTLSKMLNWGHNLSWPENANAAPSLDPPTKEPAPDSEWEQNAVEFENEYEGFIDKGNHDVTPTSAHLQTHKTNGLYIQATKASPRETEDDLELEYTERSTAWPEFSATQLLTSSPLPGQHGIHKANYWEQINESASEIAIRISVSTVLPTELTPDPFLLNPNAETSSEPPTDHQSTTLAFPTPPPLISGNHEVSEASTSLNQAGFEPPTDPDGGSQPPQANLKPKQMWTDDEVTEGMYFTSQPPPFTFTDFDYNQIVVPSAEMTNSRSDPFPTSTAASPLPTNTHTPAMNILLTHSPGLSSVHQPTPVSPQVPAYWVTGNWSMCSTSCGLGAVWRTLTCSTGSESDCDPAKRPTPAQRCYLRPCSMWKVGEWNKCSKNCGSGMKSREVQCFDMRDQRLLRPFHCRAMSARPPTQLSCNPQPCLDWYSSSWGQCSEVCGGGEQQRIVTCQEEEQCDSDLQPNNIQSCNVQPCAQWLTGSWGQCSASCGGGVRRRLIKCVNTKAETEEEVEAEQCGHEPQPESTQKCNLHECESTPSGPVCLRDRLTSRFCQSLRWLGRCHLANVRVQCCRTCGATLPFHQLSAMRHTKTVSSGS